MTTVTPAVGTEIPAFARTGNLQTWNRYAAVNDEFIDIHMDDDVAKGMGYPGVIGMGNLQTAYLHCMLRDWLGLDGGWIVRVSCQFRAFSLKGKPVVARGIVTDVRDGDPAEVDLEVWTETEGGARMATGTATVRLGGPA